MKIELIIKNVSKLRNNRQTQNILSEQRQAFGYIWYLDVEISNNNDDDEEKNLSVFLQIHKNESD